MAGREERMNNCVPAVAAGSAERESRPLGDLNFTLTLL